MVYMKELDVYLSIVLQKKRQREGGSLHLSGVTQCWLPLPNNATHLMRPTVTVLNLFFIGIMILSSWESLGHFWQESLESLLKKIIIIAQNMNHWPSQFFTKNKKNRHIITVDTYMSVTNSVDNFWKILHFKSARETLVFGHHYLYIFHRLRYD